MAIEKGHSEIGAKHRRSALVVRGVFTVVVILSGLIVAWYVPGVVAEQRLKQRFLAEAPRSWEEYRSEVCNARILVRWSGSSDASLLTVVRDKCFFVEWNYENGERRLIGQNEEYVFELEDVHGAWRLVEVRAIEDAADILYRHFNETRQPEYFWPDHLLTIDGFQLDALVKSGQLEIDRIRTVKKLDRDLVQVDFKPVESPGLKLWESAVVLLDPEKSWTINHCSWISNGKKRGSCQHVIGAIAGIPVAIASDVQIIVAMGEPYDWTDVSMINSYSVTRECEILETPVTGFRLPAFGLPEPSVDLWE